MIQRIISKIFYNTLEEGLDLFVDCLGFQVRYRDENLAVVERDGAKVYVVASPELATKDRPELAIETDSIHKWYEDIKGRRPEMLHPNGKTVQEKRGGLSNLQYSIKHLYASCSGNGRLRERGLQADSGFYAPKS